MKLMFVAVTGSLGDRQDESREEQNQHHTSTARVRKVDTLQGRDTLTAR